MKEKDHLISEFDNLTADMDIPEKRRRDWFWLHRNLAIRNQDHENFEKAYSILRDIIRHK